MITLTDELCERGWKPIDFNWNGPDAPYVRINLSLIKWSCYFQSMNSVWWDDSVDIKIIDVIKNRKFKISNLPNTIISANWVDIDFPFDDWLLAENFHLTGVKARIKSGRSFFVEYGAFSSARFISLSSLW